MKYGTSLRVRHLVGRLEKGEEVISALRQLCARERIKAGTFHGIGVLTSVELQEFDSKSKEYRTHFSAETPLEVLSLSGNVSRLGNETIINASVTVSYSAFGRRHVVGGHLAQGKAFLVEFQLTAYDDMTLERTYDAATGLPLWNRFGRNELAEMSAPEDLEAERGDVPAEVSAPAVVKREPTVIRRGRSKEEEAPKPAAPPAPVEPEVVEPPAPAEPAVEVSRARPAQRSAWDDAVRQVQVAEAKAKSKLPERKSKSTFLDDEDDEDFLVEVGDILLHPTLKRCIVAKVEDEESVYIRVGGGRMKKLSLQFFHLELEDEEGDHFVYKLKKKRRR